MDAVSSIDAVLFDMDGVLCDSEPFIREAAVRMLAERHGVQASPGDFTPFTGMGEDRFIGGVAEQYGARLDLARDKARTYALYLELIRGRLEPLRGVPAFLAACRRRGWKLAVASSADAVKVEGNLRELGLPAAQFDAVVSGQDVARRKPHPDLFLLAAARVGAEPARSVVVEDAPAGIEAAVAAGAAPLGITTSFSAAQLRSAGARWTAADLGEAAVLIPVWAGERP